MKDLIPYNKIMYLCCVVNSSIMYWLKSLFYETSGNKNSAHDKHFGSYLLLYKKHLLYNKYITMN